MSQSSVSILTECLKAHLERLVMLQEYQRNIQDPYVKPNLAFMIEDTQEAIARISSRLRQIGAAPVGRLSDEIADKLLRQSRGRRGLADQLKFVYRGLKHQFDWYETYLKTLRQDSDSQAILVALAEQNRVRLERWQNLMTEMKVPPDP
jgi:hypothetical protein